MEVVAKVPKLLEELTQSYAVQGAYKGWLLALTSGNRRVGEAALENFQAAFGKEEVLRGLAKLGKQLAEAICSFVRRHGPHPLACGCVETILVAKVQRSAPGVAREDLLQAVRETMREEYAELFGEKRGSFRGL